MTSPSIRWTLVRSLRNWAAGTRALMMGPPFPGRVALAFDFLRLRLKLWAHGLRPWDWEVDRLLGWTLRFPNAPTFVYLVEEIFIHQCYAWEPVDEEAAVRQVVDCGANIGLASLYFLRRFPEAQVIAIEPNPAALKYLEGNINHADRGRLTLHPVAAGGGEGFLILNDGGGKGGSPGASVRLSLGEAPSGDGEVRVPSHPLSQLFEGTADFLKLDVEGAEGEVLRELDRSGGLLRVRRLVMEFHPDSADPEALPRILSLLEGSGFGVDVGEPGQVLSEVTLVRAVRGEGALSS